MHLQTGHRAREDGDKNEQKKHHHSGSSAGHDDYVTVSLHWCRVGSICQSATELLHGSKIATTVGLHLRHCLSSKSVELTLFTWIYTSYCTAVFSGSNWVTVHNIYFDWTKKQGHCVWLLTASSSPLLLFCETNPWYLLILSLVPSLLSSVLFLMFILHIVWNAIDFSFLCSLIFITLTII